MKKKLKLFLVLGLLAILLTSCDEVLSLVTEGENGEKNVTNYISLMGNTVYDQTVSIKDWEKTEVFNTYDEENFNNFKNNLIFKNVNKKDKIVVVADKDTAYEITFFDGGYKYKAFITMEAFERAMDSIEF